MDPALFGKEQLECLQAVTCPMAQPKQASVSTVLCHRSRNNVEAVAAAVVRGWAAACFQHHGQQQAAKHSTVLLLIPGFLPPSYFQVGDKSLITASPTGALGNCNIIQWKKFKEIVKEDHVY